MDALIEKTTHKEKVKLKGKKKNVPDALIYEILDGQILYRKGYKQVLSKQKTLEEVITNYKTCPTIGELPF